MNKIKLEPAKRAEPKVGQLWQSNNGENLYILVEVQPKFGEDIKYVCVSLLDGDSATYMKASTEEAVQGMTRLATGTIFSLEAGD